MSGGPVAVQSVKKTCLPVEHNFLPGIHNDITLDRICPKLSWRDCFTLSSVSRAWYHAVRSRQMYNESFRSHSTETFLPGYCTSDTIALYSMREKSWYKLPPIPDVRPHNCEGRIRIPPWSQCVSMDGKIYVLGGRINSETGNRVFAFDVAGGGKWEQCSSMREPREGFKCAVKDGKIYVFGGKTVTTQGRGSEAYDVVVLNGRIMTKGRTVTTLVSASEVYDPKENAWSPIKPMKSFRCGHVAIVGDEIFVQIADSLAAYHPVKDEWRVVQDHWGRQEKQLFTAHGKFHSIHGVDIIRGNDGSLVMHESLAIHTYDIQDDSWTHLLSFSFDDLLPDDYVALYPEAVFAVEDEVVAVVTWRHENDKESGRGKQGQSLFQSRGFGSEIKDISWELRDFSFTSLPDITCYFIHKL